MSKEQAFDQCITEMKTAIEKFNGTHDEVKVLKTELTGRVEKLEADFLKWKAEDPKHAKVLTDYKARLKAFQKRTNDPWIVKWQYE